MGENRRKAVTLLNGTSANCVYNIDDQGFILYTLNHCEGDILEISEAEYDNIEAQCLKD